MCLKVINIDLNKLVQTKYRRLFSTHFLKQSCGSQELLWIKPRKKKQMKTKKNTKTLTPPTNTLLPQNQNKVEKKAL